MSDLREDNDDLRDSNNTLRSQVTQLRAEVERLTRERDAMLEALMTEPTAATLTTKLASPEAVVEAAKAVWGEWWADRLEWSENRPEVLWFETPQPETGDVLFNRPAAALDAYQEVKP